MRAELNDFPTSSPFLGLSRSLLDLKHVLFRSLLHTDWILFLIFLGQYFPQFRSETDIMSAKFNEFPTSSEFFGSFGINFRSETWTF